MIGHKIVFGSLLSPLKVSDASIACYILENSIYIFDKSDLQKALHYEGKSENLILDVLTNIAKFSNVPKKLLDAYSNPVNAQHHNTIGGKNNLVKGIEVSAFVETCQIIVNAKNEGYLNVNQLKYARAAQNILKHLENQNLFDFIDLSIGFEFYKENIKSRIAQFLHHNLNDDSFYWITTLPELFFENLFQIYELSWPELEQNYGKAARIFLDTIFMRIPNTLLEQLRVEKPKRSYRRVGNKVQEKEHRELQHYTTAILSLMGVAAKNRNIFLQLLNRSYPKNNAFDNTDLSFLEKPVNRTEKLTPFDETLKKGVSFIKTYTQKNSAQK